MPFIRKYAWYFVSLLLLSIYLTFFHLLNIASPNGVQVSLLGAIFSSVWLATCFICQTVFRNRFEFGIHSLLTVDFVLEALVPVHSGLGFYFCALGFWTVFLVYHHYPIRLMKSVDQPQLVQSNEPTV